MTVPLRPEHFRTAAQRFKAFFEELGETFIEREDVLQQIALALLCREHVLLTGPPGTAKSGLASAVFGRILCEDSGAPSVYARHITESTVQTDLIGPIDFRNLMETGRTTHFTDEGMLGAVHAFLDEIFDGRDMLLRSALNVLQERELKQGTETVKGHIECALMTTNRYIADVIEQSREALLAFVDRIAFVGFVPRGFADPANLDKVLRRHVGRSAISELDALLTIQDLDVLQAAVDAVHVCEPLCGALAKLVSDLDAELNDAVRADAQFVPTRYLSTRTAVRSGRVLRAVAVYDRIFSDPERPLQALNKDLAMLRLHFILTGPTRSQLDALATQETHAAERRQLEILRTEREIFERCLERVPTVNIIPTTIDPWVHDEEPAVAAAVASADAEKAAMTASDKAAAHAAKPKPDKDEQALSALADRLQTASAESDFPELVGLAQTLTREQARLAGEHSAHVGRCSALLDETVSALSSACLRAVLSAQIAPRDDALQAAVELGRLAASVEDHTVSLHENHSWLRQQALSLIDEIAPYAPGRAMVDLELALRPDAKGAEFAPSRWLEQAMARSRERLAALEQLAEIRRQILDQGLAVPREPAGGQLAETTAETPSPGGDSLSSWQLAVDEAETDVAVIWDRALCASIETLLDAQRDAPLDDVLSAVAPELNWLDELAGRFTRLRAAPTRLKARALGPRLGRLIQALLARVDALDRETLHEEIEAVLEMLRPRGLEGTIAPTEWMTWATDALVRSDQKAPQPPTGKPSHEGYRSLRNAEQRVPIAYTLCEVALRVAPEVAQAGAHQGIAAVAALLAEVPDELRAEVLRLDVARIGRAVTYLESWWQELNTADRTPAARLDAMVEAKLFEVLWDESALARFALELRLIDDVHPEQASSHSELRQRLLALHTETRDVAHELLQDRTDTAWAKALEAS